MSSLYDGLTPPSPPASWEVVRYAEIISKFNGQENDLGTMQDWFGEPSSEAEAVLKLMGEAVTQQDRVDKAVYLSAKISPDFELIGLGLTAMHNSKTGVSSIAMTLEEPEWFASYLDSVDPGDVSENDSLSFQFLLGEVLLHIEEQIVGERARIEEARGVSPDYVEQHQHLQQYHVGAYRTIRASVIAHGIAEDSFTVAGLDALVADVDEELQ